MNPSEDNLDGIEIWVYNETEDGVADNAVEPHFHVCIGKHADFYYEIDIEVKIKKIEQLIIWRSVSGHTSWYGLDELFFSIKNWLNEKAYDAEITKKKAIKLEWNRNNLSNRVDKDEL